jgi:hypothetical protein
LRVAAVHAIASSLVYVGLVVALLGAVSIVKPPSFLRIPNRAVAAGLVAFGVALGIVGILLPCPVGRSARPATRIDEFVPAFQFAELHETHVHAPPAQVWVALRAVTASEIRLFRALTWIRSPRWPWSRTRESILAPSSSKPILDVALAGGFVVLAEEPGRELVVGFLPCRTPSARTSQEFLSLERPGDCRAALNFLLEDRGPAGTRLTTETRVFATDEPALRGFRRYWRLIYPGSAIIRHSWLAAIKRRAETVPPPAPRGRDG